MKRKAIVLVVLLPWIVCSLVGAQDLIVLEDCVDDVDSDHFCADSTAVLVDEGCGAVFNRYHGRIAWPVLRYAGPVTIAVKTRVRPELNSTTRFPLYIEVVPRGGPDTLACHTGSAPAFVVLAALGGPVCGGTWESIGPLDLRQYGIVIGEHYNIRATFFETVPSDLGPSYHTIGFSCIRITSHPTATASSTWSNVKALFR